jgi:hypothetical protein
MNTGNKFQLQIQPLFTFEKEGMSAANAGRDETTTICPITSTLTTTNTVSAGCTTG